MESERGRSINNTCKPTFGQICLAHTITAETLTRASGLRDDLVSALVLRNYCARQSIAERAIDALNALAGTHFTLSDVSIDWYPPEEQHSVGGYSARYGAIFRTRPIIYRASRVHGYSAKYGDIGAARRIRPPEQEERQES